MNYHDVLDKILDTNDTTVGGGSASALSGAMGAGLCGMVALLSKGKDYGPSDGEYEAVEKQCKELQKALLKGAVEDTEAYSMVVRAFRLPKDTDKEKEARKAAIQHAGTVAAATPRDNGKRCKQVYELAVSIREKSNPNAASDLMYGIELARLGIEGCIANIEANLSLIGDADTVAGFQADIQALRK